MGACATRGSGLLENFLARKRERMASRLIERRAPRSYRLLDVGCGSFPFFLSRSPFREKYGIDQFVDESVVAALAGEGIELRRYDVEEGDRLPFSSEFFDVVTMLAVFEHIRSDRLSAAMREIYRVLRPGGLCVLTTPASWTDPILSGLARLRLLSPVEIGEHEHTYTHDEIIAVLDRGGFPPDHVDCGSFELGMNLWICAAKPAGASEPSHIFESKSSVDGRRQEGAVADLRKRA